MCESHEQYPVLWYGYAWRWLQLPSVGYTISNGTSALEHPRRKLSMRTLWQEVSEDRMRSPVMWSWIDNRETADGRLRQ